VRVPGSTTAPTERMRALKGLPDGLTVAASSAPGARRSATASGTPARTSSEPRSTIASTAVGGIIATNSPALLVRAVMTPSNGARSVCFAS
jgi:hypothetical protein